MGILSLDPSLKVVGAAENERTAARLLRKCSADILVMDSSFAFRDNSVAITELRAAFPRLRILVLGAIAEQSDRDEAMNAGASGFCWKDAPASEILSALKRI